MKPYRYRGGFLCAGVIACTLISCFAPPHAVADTNLHTTARSRDDKGAMVNLALQVAQQLQAQQESNLRAINEAKQQAEAAAHQTGESVASLRRLTLLIGGTLALGILGLLLYARRLVRLLQLRPQVAGLTPAPHEVYSAEALVRKGVALEQLNRFEEALAWYDRALSLDATLTEAYVGKGRVLNQLERYSEALECYERASQLQPRVDAPRLDAHRSPRAAA